MGIITTILLIFLVLLVLVLIIPFHISLNLQKNGGIFEGLFELKVFNLRIFKKEFPEESEKDEADKKAAESEKKILEKLEKEEIAKEKKAKEIIKKEEKIAEEKDKEKTEEKKRKWNWDDIKTILKLVWDAKIYLIQFLEDILKSVDLDKFNLHIILGLDSTADTATKVGYIWAVASILNIYPAVHISAEPSFFNFRIDGEILLEFKTRLIRQVGAILRLLTKKPVLKLLWELRRFRK